MKSSGLNPARTGPARAEARPRAPALQVLQKGPVFLNNLKRGHNSITCVADTCRKVPALPFLHSLKSPMANDARPRSGELSPADLLND